MDKCRFEACFKRLKDQNQTGLVTFTTAGDPDTETAQTILDALPGCGADIIELGMPFSDPVADGPVIQRASERALENGMTLEKTLSMVRQFRNHDTETPLLLMGYFNPIHNYDPKRFCLKAKESGVDGMIIVDLPPEEAQEVYNAAHDHNLHVIHLVTPTTPMDRLDLILEHATGFLYYVAVAGITGTKSANAEDLENHLTQIRTKTNLPIAVGFGIKTPDDAKNMSHVADAVVVGSALVSTIAQIKTGAKTIDDLTTQVKALAEAL